MGVAQISNTIDDVGKDCDGLNLSPTKVTPGNSIVNREGNLHDENDGQTQSKSTANPNKGTFYANLFTGGLSKKTMNFHTLFTPAGNKVDVVVSVESIRAISERFANTGKYGLVKSMLNSSTGIFSFQFSSMDGLDAMLENGPWFIRNNPLILKKWNPDVNLLTEDVHNVPVCGKLHGVLVTAFNEDGLSVIATKLDTPLMLDSYTSAMCFQS
ncbi:putative reverse transcriptase domain-containing protein [Tanacetum coccineum]